MDLPSALEALETSVGMKAPFGADRLPPESRYSQIILFLRDIICPKATEILARLKKEGTTLVTIISDILLATFSGTPIPVTTVAKSIAIVGVERFCTDPTAILSH